MTSNAPTRTRSGSGIARPHTMAAPPAAMNDRPLVVSDPNSDRMAPLPSAPARESGPGSPPGQWQLRDDPLHHVLGLVALHDGFGRGQQPVREHRAGQGLHVVRDHVVPPVERGPGTAGP